MKELPIAQIPRPPKDVFEDKVNNSLAQVTYEAQDLFYIDHIEYPESGGIFVYLKGVLYPTKGFPTPEAVATNNVPKRYLIGQLQFLSNKSLILPALTLLLYPYKAKIKLLTNWIATFNDFANRFLQPYFLKDRYYMEMTKELDKLATFFLSNIGVAPSVASQFGKIFKHMIEYDSAYRLRLEDILSETSAERICANPRLEIQRLLEIFKERDIVASTQSKFTLFAKVLSWVMLIPKIRDGFCQAIWDIDFKKLQFDEADRYHCLPMDDRYFFFGKHKEERIMEYIALHKGVLPPTERVRGV